MGQIMKKMKPLTESPRFRKFIQERDHALEEILTKYLRQTSSIVDVLKERTMEIASHLSAQGHSHYRAKAARTELERRLTPWFDMAIRRAAALLQSLRRTTYVISYSGQAEGIARATGKPTKAELSAQDISEILSSDAPSGGTIHARAEIAFHRLLRDVVDAYQLSQVVDSDIQETLDRLDRAFPKVKQVKKVRAPIARMTEAKRPDEEEAYELSFGMIEEADWDAAVEDYLSEFVPFGRAPDDKLFASLGEEPGEQVEIYQWEFEQEVVEDFVQMVRGGEVDAANDNGINDMQWIAIIDAKTDDCCFVRDGLTTTEIEAKLNDGEDMGDCDAVVPPAHFWCRCRLAPMTDDMPDHPPPDFGSFDQWLGERAKE